MDLRIRDFVCMHYHYNQREDAPFWKMCREMEIPESLRQRVELFRQGGHAFQKDGELFTVDSWISVMMGQHIEPVSYHHIARVDDREAKEYMAKYRAQVAQVVNGLPLHGDFIKQYCDASEAAWS
ncbi:MAG TPA: tryptophan 7-halogenase [Steroidobacteraceae bacterium]|nr:tryptophan 7-halogenase [Steroidobacteraceae bacterium]